MAEQDEVDQGDEFDLDGWIAGAQAPRRIVTVYGRGDLVARAEQLAADIAHAERDRDPERLVSGATGGQRRELDAVRAEFEGSALTFEFRAPTRDEIRAAADALGKDASEDDQTFAMLSLQVVRPKVASVQWPAIRDRIGTGQFQALLDAANATYADSRLDVPFSRATSAAGRTSSRS